MFSVPRCRPCRDLLCGELSAVPRRSLRRAVGRAEMFSTPDAGGRRARTRNGETGYLITPALPLRALSLVRPLTFLMWILLYIECSRPGGVMSIHPSIVPM